jgi:hypothetical protein
MHVLQGASAVSTFYLLPPRPVLGERFARYLQTLFPDLSWRPGAWPELADTLTAAVAGHADVYVVYGDDLPIGEDPAQALTDVFGAEEGDEVIEVRLGEESHQRWLVGSDERPEAP